MTIAKKIDGFISQSSFIRKMFEEGVRLKKRYGAENVFDFSLGNPNLNPPEDFCERLRQIVTAEIPGKHMYMPNAGYPETRAAVASAVSSAKGITLTADQIVMTCGAGGALNVIFKTLLDPGEEVIIPAPFFVEYRFYVDNAGGVARIVPTREDFSLDLDAIREAITDKTKAVLINSPNNPTGKVYDQDSITALAALLTERGRALKRVIYLISDEPYTEIVYDGVKVPSVLKAYPHSLIATSYSKSLSLPGERIGYIAVNPEIGALGASDGRPHPLQPDPRFRERPLPHAAGHRRSEGGESGCGDLPEKAGPPLRRTCLRGLPGEKAGRRLLPLSPDAHCRRCPLCERPSGAADTHRPGERLLRSRPYPDRLLCGRCHDSRRH